MAGMSAAQIAKIEAKRAAKAAKAAAKGAAKKEKKAAGLGVGCAELRQLVAPSGGGGSVGAEEIAAKLDPFRMGEVRKKGAQEGERRRRRRGVRWRG